jgi:hypothetical protein
LWRVSFFNNQERVCEGSAADLVSAVAANLPVLSFQPMLLMAQLSALAQCL